MTGHSWEIAASTLKIFDFQRLLAMTVLSEFHPATDEPVTENPTPEDPPNTLVFTGTTNAPVTAGETYTVDFDGT